MQPRPKCSLHSDSCFAIQKMDDRAYLTNVGSVHRGQKKIGGKATVTMRTQTVITGERW